MRTLTLLAALTAALYATAAHAQLTPSLATPAAEDCVGCNTTFVQPPPVGGHDGCTSGDECDYVPSVPSGPNEGEYVESPCWLLICPGGDGWPPPVVDPVICGEACAIYNDDNQPPPTDPPPADPPFVPFNDSPDDWWYPFVGSVTIGAT